MTVPLTLDRVRWTLRTGETYQLVLTRTAVATYVASGDAHTAATYSGNATKIADPHSGDAPALVFVTLGASWNDRSVDAQVAAALRDLGRALGVYRVGTSHAPGGAPAMRPLTFPLTGNVLALFAAGTWTGQRAAGHASGLRLLAGGELPGDMTIYCAPYGNTVAP